MGLALYKINIFFASTKLGVIDINLKSVPSLSLIPVPLQNVLFYVNKPFE